MTDVRFPINPEEPTETQPAPGGGTSSAVTLTVTNPVPSISNISPSVALVLGNSFTLTVNGSGLINGSVVEYDGSPRVNTFVSPTQVTAQITNGMRVLAVLRVLFDNLKA